MHRIRSQQNIHRIRKFQKRMGKSILSNSIPLHGTYRLSKEPIPFIDRLDGKYSEIHKGEKWGETWDSGWFHITGKIPHDWSERKTALHLDFNGEALIFDSEGTPVYGLTNGSVFDSNYSKDIFRLPERYTPGDNLDLWVETAANHLSGLDLESDPERNNPKRHGNREGRVNHMSLCYFNESLWHLWIDIKVLYNLIEYLPENSPRREKLIYKLNVMIDIFADNPENCGRCRDFIKALWTPANSSDLTVTGIGHAHIDTGWLWPVRETIRKCARTFASQIDLIEKYPDYIFGASQPQHYQFIKEHYPSLYEKIKKSVAAGRWELQGGMWVEADCNVISGESMIRQFLHGKNFYMDEFGEDVKNLWLPDVFGYSAAMPQILKKSGIDFFMTQKISWNQYNKFPFHLFNWKGIDSTEIVTHFLPEDTYNAKVSPLEAGKAQDRFTENYICNEFVSLFGIGNGGGGPTEEYIERGIRMQNLEGSPKFRFGRADEAFKRMRDLAPQLPSWSGELYLELHRGTLTTQALTKKYNRILENKLRSLEYICSSLPYSDYPSEPLDRIWKNLLMNQFHDIIPGSSIHMVYERAHREYESMIAEMDIILTESVKQLFEEDENSLLIINILSSVYTAPISIPPNWENYIILDTEEKEIPTQKNNNGLWALVPIEANGSITLSKGAKRKNETRTHSQSLILENSLIRYELDESGSILKAFDKEQKRDVLRGKGNDLTLYVDRPDNWDAWDIDITYENMRSAKVLPISVSNQESGNVCDRLEFHLKIGQSTLTQNVSLPANSKRIDFEIEIDWKERHKMLRTSFPLDINSSEANCDIQYGYISRPTHRNTSWDMAKFEVAAHRYVDISDKDYGAALLNDCKYGYKIYDNIIDLNLLRSTTNPDPDADYHHHSFCYSFLPHDKTLIDSEVINEAAMMNNRPLVLEGYKSSKIITPCTIKGTGVSFEVIKKAEKEDCRIIRLVETMGKKNTAELIIHEPDIQVVETDLMEWEELKKYTVSDRKIKLEFSPFEIKTFKLK